VDVGVCEEVDCRLGVSRGGAEAVEALDSVAGAGEETVAGVY